MNDESILPFGKYKGSKLIDVPDDYLIWCYKNLDPLVNARLFEYIKDSIPAHKLK